MVVYAIKVTVHTPRWLLNVADICVSISVVSCWTLHSQFLLITFLNQHFSGSGNTSTCGSTARLQCAKSHAIAEKAFELCSLSRCLPRLQPTYWKTFPSADCPASTTMGAVMRVGQSTQPRLSRHASLKLLAGVHAPDPRGLLSH